MRATKGQSVSFFCLAGVVLLGFVPIPTALLLFRTNCWTSTCWRVVANLLIFRTSFTLFFFVQFDWETELDDIGIRFGSRIPVLVPGSAWKTMGTKLQGIFLRRKLWYPMMVDDLIQLGKCLLRSTFGQWKNPGWLGYIGDYTTQSI